MVEVEFIEVKDAFYESVKGWAFFPFQSGSMPFADVDGQSFHVVKILPGEIRGNHRHPGVDEWLHVFSGPAVLHWRDAQGQPRKREISNEYTVVRVAAGVPHALLNPGPGLVYTVSFRARSGHPDQPKAEEVQVL